MKIAIVNDLRMAVECLRRVVGRFEEHEIIWTAADGEGAVQKCKESLPDLILMDLIMP
ncbi:MAG TPA: response regulator, partial [Verrucomicrobia bacterium]|nr:response regulator [Verrucomicrobiota bacterium]